MLSWADRFNIFCFLDNHHYSVAPHHLDCLLGVGAAASAGTLDEASTLAARFGRTAFGHLSYSLKEELHGLPQTRPDPIGFPPLHWFIPEYEVELRGDQLFIEGPNPDQAYRELLGADPLAGTSLPVAPQPLLTQEEYLTIIRLLQGHLRRGDCYEINFCQPFVASTVSLHPVDTFLRLTELSPTPFAALYRQNERYLLCASPERFLTRAGERLISQPMKGTIRRHLQDAAADAELKEVLRRSAKDRSENVMVVDLVRNDLTPVCQPGSVQVDELFGIYTYPNVHQMISTVSGQCRPGVQFADIIRSAFPMGSMTGAPKRRVMELIEQYEPLSRGLFSGSVGYLRPNGDFDLNVVIRSILYDRASGHLQYLVGSGITIYSEPEREWEECLLKAEAMKKVLSGG